jgi:type I site-specific restriction-modification system R (restriction) subunit
MITIDSKELPFRIRESEKGDEIFDSFRKKWVVLTPEEWVRQTLLGYLVQQKQYPSSLIAVERGLKVGELSRRFDAVIFNRNGNPFMVIECKAPGEKIEDAAVSQLLAYQSVLGAAYLMLSNGHSTRCWRIEGNNVTEQSEIPSSELL